MAEARIDHQPERHLFSLFTQLNLGPRARDNDQRVHAAEFRSDRFLQQRLLRLFIFLAFCTHTKHNGIESFIGAGHVDDIHAGMLA